ncbi:MAG TPA: ANTAR domain-containing protein [Streptosporangiaceae bacterium]|jgi:hypothetical protein
MNDDIPERTADAHGAPPASTPVGPEIAVVRRSGQGWRVGDDELPDLTSAMVLADLLAADDPGSLPPSAAGQEAAEPAETAAEATRLRVTVAQLEAALVRRVRVEQAIGIICERRRVPPRKAFEMLRAEARAAGGRVAELAGKVVESAVNPLVLLPGELARPAREPRERGRSPRHVRDQD